jgi:hypothetical protein
MDASEAERGIRFPAVLGVLSPDFELEAEAFKLKVEELLLRTLLEVNLLPDHVDGGALFLDIASPNSLISSTWSKSISSARDEKLLDNGPDPKENVEDLVDGLETEDVDADARRFP